MLLTRKSSHAGPASSSLVSSLKRGVQRAIPTMDRRAFLRRSGLGVGAGIAASSLTLVKKARAADPAAGPAKNIEVKRTVCGHCSVGCAIDAVVENGVWVRQEPVFDSPINLGAHCAKGAAVRENGHGEFRLKYPMKLVDGKYQKISWDQALDEISAKMLELRKQSGPDSVFIVGSSKHNNEQAYLLRKWVSFWGSNNTDHQARICHSTTVAGVANTWGYGAMTNSYNDMQNSKAAMYIGSNAAEAHPVSMLHMLHAKESGCKMIVVDPRFTRTAAKADEYVRIRSGTDIPFLFGVLHHIFKNGWEDKKYIEDRVYGMDKVREEVLAKWTPDKVQEACGVDEATCYKVAKIMAENRPSTLVWCMGQTQHSIGNAIVRASCIVQLALGNVGVSGGGANIFRGHDNVQGATDIGPNPDSLPGYYGLAEGAWKLFAKVWNVDFEWIKKQYAPGMMGKPGMTVSRWIDGVLEKNELIDQDSNLRGMFFWGHAPNSQSRGLEMKKAMDKLDLLVVIDPFPSATAAMAAMPGKPGEQNANRAVYLLPACTQFETSGSCTASNRSIQWRERVIEPLWESRPDHMIMVQLADKLGFGKELTKNYKMVAGKGGLMEPEPESILREINKCTWTIGYTGQSPERLKAHMRNMNVFDVKTLRAKGGIDKETGYQLAGDYFGLPWPCYGTPAMRHPGVMKVHGCHPFGNAKARAVVWNFPDPVPQHREPLYSNRPELVAKYPTHDDKKAFWRLPTLYKSVQEKNKDIGKTFPLIMTSGRLTEFEGGGEETRSNPWLAELQQEMFVELNPKTANDRGIRNGDWVYVKTPPMTALPEFKGLRVKAMVTERVDAETVFLPFHFSGRWGGMDLAPYYPDGAKPVIRGESVNTATTYGYDSVTMMQETKTTVCQIERATA
ncbi:MAG: formate dehydrogenase subunit alpha [Burkholderiales bacterium]|nr:formate dehydrogenase subunit alpha [Burkholderiales bacterium]